MADLSDSDPKVPPRPLPDTTKSNNGLPEWGVDDLVPKERKRLGDYIAYQTQQVFKNEYPIKEGSELFKLKTETGNPAPINDQDRNAVNTYMNDVAQTDSGQVARSIFETLSDSGLLDTDTKFEIKKGKSDDDKKTGNEYFRDIDQNKGEAEIPQRIQTIMFQNNRFSEANPAFVPGQEEGRGNSIGSLIVQPKLGQHMPGKFPKKADGDGGDYVSIPIDKLKNFGLTTLLQASGEINVPTDLDDPVLAMGASVLAGNPGLARLGQRFPVTRFDGVKILNDLEPTLAKPLRDSQLKGNPILTHGNANNPLVPFSGLIAISSVASAQVLALTVTGMLRALYTTLNAITEERSLVNGVATNPGSGGSISSGRRLRLGNYLGKRDETAIYRPYKNSSAIDLVVTKYPYFECVNKGIAVFFGARTLPQISSVNDENLQLSSGWYNTVFRNLVKNTNDLLIDLLPGTPPVVRGAYDVDPNLAGGTSGLGFDSNPSAVNYIKSINGSVILKFMNIMALMGESAFLSEKNATSRIDDINDVGEGPFGEVSPRLGVLHAKNRLSDQFGNKLAWASNTVKSMYLLPSVIKLAGERFDGDTGRYSTLTPNRGFRNSDTGRLSSEEVQSMENYLEADYLPFYFHDLRTNEIISFHAFLDNISDNYTVDYTENEGYGRVGKVLTYKNTNRSISLGFSVVATGPDDFDDMWVKINKLITLLYPQYTQGRSLIFGNDSFTQPFSQLPAASPLIRLRLGDIFKSNYNRFDLARLFGLASPEFSLETEADRELATQTAERRERFLEATTEISERARAARWEEGDKLKLSPNGEDILPYYSVLSTSEDDGLRVATEANVIILGPSANQEEPPSLFDFRIEEPSVASVISGDPSGTFKANAAWLTMPPEEIVRQAENRAGEEPTLNEAADRDGERQAIQDFFKPDGEDANPIFKSFESVRGRGLAGFIRSLNMEVDQSFTWETSGINNRAPKLIKVSMQFDPIHDIQPGLDHNGFNTAPIYNVGGTMKQITRNSQAEVNSRETDYKTNTQITTNRTSRRERA
jgi:hypothetical protein